VAERVCLAFWCLVTAARAYMCWFKPHQYNGQTAIINVINVN
jgi:hypothetical protein